MDVLWELVPELYCLVKTNSNLDIGCDYFVFQKVGEFSLNLLGVHNRYVSICLFGQDT